MSNIINKDNDTYKLDTKSKILNSAFEIMVEKGIKNTTLSDIAKKVGISKGTLYYYYSTKEDIIYDIADKNMTQITDELIYCIESMGEDINPNIILETLFEKILNAEDRSKLHIYLLNEAIISNNDLIKKFKIKYEDWQNTLNNSLNKIFPKNKDKNFILSHIILASLDGFIIQKMFGLGDISISDVANMILK